jgi:hypothetical protein
MRAKAPARYQWREMQYISALDAEDKHQTLQDLHTVYFPWWSVMTISRIVKVLEEKELIIIGNYNKLGYDRTQWYALNDVGIAKLTSVLMHSDAIYQNDKSISQNGKSIYQNDDMDSNKMINGTQQIDTTIPKSTQKNTQESEKPKRAARTPPLPKQRNLDSFNQAVLIYKELSGKNNLSPALITLIVDQVAEMERWRTTVQTWLGSGFNPLNVSGMLDWYAHPEKMAAKQAQGNGHRTNGQPERVAPTAGMLGVKAEKPAGVQSAQESAAQMLKLRQLQNGK